MMKFLDLKLVARLVVPFYCLIFLVGCLTTRSQLRSHDSSSRAASEAAPLSPEVRRANQMADIDEMDQQLRQFNGRIEQVENQLAQINAGHHSQQDQDKRTRDQQELKFKAYEEELKKQAAQIAALTEEVRVLRARNERPASTGPKNSLEVADQAFEKKQWEQAIVEYEAFRKANAKSKQYSTATLKIGMAFQELKMKDEAKAFFEEVIAKFPKSQDAKTATKRLKALK